MIQTEDFWVKPIAEHQVRDLLQWRYEPPFDFYDPPADRAPEEYIREFLNPDYQFHAILDRSGRFAGFCSYGIDGQVPGGDYQEAALDIGLGMRPELTGQGVGFAFVAAILSYAGKHFPSRVQRMTVADFNERAFRLYYRFGFRGGVRFRDSYRQVPYTVLTRTTPVPISRENR